MVRGLLIVLSLIVLILFFLPLILQRILENKLRHWKSGALHYSTLTTNLLSSKAELRNLSFSVPLDIARGNHPILFHIDRLQIKGVQLGKLIWNKQLELDEVISTHPIIELDSTAISELFSLPKQIQSFPLAFQQLNIHRFRIDSMIVMGHQNGRSQQLLQGSIVLGQMVINNDTAELQPWKIKSYKIDLHTMNLPLKASGKNIFIQHLQANSDDGRWQLDTCQLNLREETKRSNGTDAGYMLHCSISHVEGQLLPQENNAAANWHFSTVSIQGSRVEVKQTGPSSVDIIDRFSMKGLPMHLKIDYLKWENGVIEYQGAYGEGALKADVMAKGIESKEHDPEMPLSIFSITASVTEAHYRPKKVPYMLSMDHLLLESERELLTIGAIQVRPLYGKMAFGRIAGHQVDRIESTISGISLLKVKTQLLMQKKVWAKELSIEQSRTFIFRDRRLPLTTNVKLLPVAYLKSLPGDLRIQKVMVKNSSVRYEEYPKQGGHTGTMDTQIESMQLSPLINHPKSGDASVLVLQMKGSIMNNGEVQADMNLPLHSSTYLVKGAIRNLDLTSLNNGAENLGNLHIASGLLDSLGFDFSFDENKAEGKIVGVYHHLILQQLKQNRDDTKKVARFRSFVLRHLIIPLNKDRSLPEKKRTGTINYKRDPTRYVSYYLLQSLLTGIKSSFRFGFLLPK